MANRTKVFSAAIAALVMAGAIAFMYGKNVGNTASAQSNEDAENTQASNGPPPAIVATAIVERRSLAPVSQMAGSVVSIRDSEIASATDGQIEWIANIGDEVKEGAIIARIDKSDALLQRDDSAAEVERLQSRADYLTRLHERFSALGEDSGESDAALDEMQSNRNEATQALARAKVTLRRANVNLTRTDVVAPFSGRIVTREIQIGEYATIGRSIARLVDTQNLEVTLRAPAALALDINAGTKISVSDGSNTFEAEVRAVVPVGDELSRLLEIRLALPETPWFIGSPVQVSLPTRKPVEATAVHRDALVLRSDGTSIFVVDSDNKAKRVHVELGASEGDFIEVIGEIQPGESVVVRGGERLRDGQAVEIASNPQSLTT